MDTEILILYIYIVVHIWVEFHRFVRSKPKCSQMYSIINTANSRKVSCPFLFCFCFPFWTRLSHIQFINMSSHKLQSKLSQVQIFSFFSFLINKKEKEPITKPKSWSSTGPTCPYCKVQKDNYTWSTNFSIFSKLLTKLIILFFQKHK